MPMMVSFYVVFFPRDILDEIWDLIESVSDGFPTYSFIELHIKVKHDKIVSCFDKIV